MKKIINDTMAPKAVGTYSQGVEINGTFYFSGQIGINPETSQMVTTGFKDELDQILKNIDHLLKGCNLTRENIFKTTIFLTDLENFNLVNEAYTNFFKAPFPARSCVEVSRLPKDALVEIEVLAQN